MEKVTPRFSLQGNGDAFDLSAEGRLRGPLCGRKCHEDLLKWNLSMLKLTRLNPYGSS